MKRYFECNNQYEKQRLREELIHLPEPNGVRGSTLYKQRRWKKELLTISEPFVDMIPQTQLCIEGLYLGKRLLNEQVSSRLIQGLLLSNDSRERGGRSSGSGNVYYGTHPMCRIDFGECSMYVKLFPEYAGNEKAAYLLMERVIGGGIPESELCQLTDSRGTNYPIIIIRTVVGKNIKESYCKKSDDEDRKLKINQKRKEETIEKLKEIEVENFSKLFIGALLTCNEDGKTDNIVLHRQYNLENMSHCLKTNDGKPLHTLTFIDNERCFLPTVVKVEKEIQLQMKHFIFCMDQMKESVHKKVKQELNLLNPYLLLNEWLHDLEEENRRCLKVFGQDKICQYSNLNDEKQMMTTMMMKEHFLKRTEIVLPKHPVVLPVVFVNGVEESLFGKLRYLKILVEKYPNISHKEILQRLEPVAFKSYSKLLDDKRLDNSLSRWKILEEKYYQIGKLGTAISTLKGTTIALQTLEIKTKQSLAQLINGQLKCCYAPGMSQHRLLRHYQVNTIQDELKQGNTQGFLQLITDTMRCQVLEEMPFKYIPLETQSIIFNSVKDVCFSHLFIKDANGLTDNMIKYIFVVSGEHLVNVELSNCSQLTESTIGNLAYFCPNLQKLILTNLVGLKYFHNSNYLQRLSSFNGLMLSMPSLTYLNIDHCSNLKQIQLWAPVLEITNIQITKNSSIIPKELVRWVQFLFMKRTLVNSELLEKTYQLVSKGSDTLELSQQSQNESEFEYFIQLLKWGVPIKKIKCPIFNVTNKNKIIISLEGAMNCGKTSLANRLITGNFSYESTEKDDSSNKVNYTFQTDDHSIFNLQIKHLCWSWFRFTEIYEYNYRFIYSNSNIFMFLASCEDKIDDINRYFLAILREIDSYCGSEHPIKIFVLTKCDLEHKHVSDSIKNLAEQYEFHYFECSSKTGDGVRELFQKSIDLYVKTNNIIISEVNKISFIDMIKSEFPSILIEEIPKNITT